MRTTIKKFCVALATILAVSAPSLAQEKKGGTMDLMPDTNVASAVSDESLGKLRGGFFGIAFNVAFTAMIENGTLTGGGTYGTTGGSFGSTPTQTSISGGQVNISAFVGSLQNVNGIFNIVQVPGSYNVVNTQLTVQIALINLLNTSNIPSLSTIFAPR